METKNIEKEFKIEVIASLIENRLLCDAEDLYDLCSFVTGEYIDEKNFYLYVDKVKKIILNFHPELNNRVLYYRNDYLYKIDIETLITYYQNKFGNEYIVKSLKKCLVKSLKMQDK